MNLKSHRYNCSRESIESIHPDLLWEVRSIIRMLLKRDTQSQIITNPKSSPLELQASMPDDMIPCVPIIIEGEEPLRLRRRFQKRCGLGLNLNLPLLDGHG